MRCCWICYTCWTFLICWTLRVCACRLTGTLKSRRAWGLAGHAYPPALCPPRSHAEYQAAKQKETRRGFGVDLWLWLGLEGVGVGSTHTPKTRLRRLRHASPNPKNSRCDSNCKWPCRRTSSGRCCHGLAASEGSRASRECRLGGLGAMHCWAAKEPSSRQRGPYVVKILHAAFLACHLHVCKELNGQCLFLANVSHNREPCR